MVLNLTPPEVILPCDLPSWGAVQAKMVALQAAGDIDAAIAIMESIRKAERP